MAEGSREQKLQELISIRVDRNVMANHVAAAVDQGNIPKAEELAAKWRPLWDQAIELWLRIGDETGLHGRIES